MKVLATPTGARVHASRGCPSLRGAMIVEVAERSGMSRCQRPACRAGFADLEAVPEFRVNVISLGVATIAASTKAEAVRRARADDFDSYELQAPYAAITSLAKGESIQGALPPVQRPIVFRKGG